MEHSWPGNVRELENAIERGVALTVSGPLTADVLPSEFSRRVPPREVVFRIGSSLGDIERRMIAETLRYTDGDKAAAAEILGITSRTIYRKLERRRKELAHLAQCAEAAQRSTEPDDAARHTPAPADPDAQLDSARRAGS